VAKSAGVVEINGHRYDSASGAVVGVIDGFVRRKSVAAKPKPTAHKSKASAKKVSTRTARVAKASTKIHHRPQPSRTLMRKVVMRPTLRLREISSSAVAKASKPMARTIDNSRLEKAKAIGKNPRVSRFSATPKGRLTTIANHAIKKTATVRPLTAALAVTLPQTIDSHQKLEQMLDKALFAADAHKQALSRRSNRFLRPFGIPRWAAVILFGLFILAIGVIIAWRSIPAIAIRVASMRSHVSATVPAYVPSGFSFSQVKSADGSLTIKYSAKGDHASTYSVSQASSSWDSQSLKANTLGSNKAVQSSEVGGTTVYIYGNSDNAEWVSNGNLYKINNQAHLSSDQIINIAQSL
jgi:hypothetical protein